MNFGCWNVKGINTKEKVEYEEMERFKIFFKIQKRKEKEIC